jgi:hypothetical protein
MGRTCSKNGEFWVLVGKSGGKRSLERPRRRWEDNVKMDLRCIGFVGMDSIDLAEDEELWKDVVNTVMKIRVL